MKKNTKLNKFMAGSVTAALVASAVAPAVSAAENNFQDIVALDAEAQAAINALADAGVVKGYDNGTKFDPWQNVKRGQVALMLTRVAELGLDSEADTDTNFTDVTGDIELIGAVEALVNEEIASGYTDGTFKPYAQISRQHMAKLIVKAFDLELNEDVEVNITDLDEATTEMAEYIKILASHGITTQTEFNPQAPVSRYAFTLFLTRAMDAINTAEIVEVSELETITVKEGEELELPETVEVTYADETTGEEAVEWNTEDVDTDIPGEYEVEGTIEGTDLTATVEVVVEAVEPEVVTAEAVNAKQVVITFNKAIDEDTLFEDVEEGTLVEDVVTIDTIGEAVDFGALTGELSEDGKTLTLTAANTFDGRYNITVVGAKSKDDLELVSYTNFFDADDTTRPAVAEVSYTDVNTAKITFSEPIEEVGTVTLNGKAATVTEGFDFITVNISSLDFEEEGTVTIVGAKDFAGNLVTPNPVNVTVERPAEDVTAPEVESIKAVSDSRVEVVFSEELATVDFEINGNSVDAGIADDNVTYYLDANLLDGVNKVEVTNITDLAGNEGEDVTRQLVVELDEEAPELESADVLVNKDGEEYLQLSFSEAVELTTEEKTFTGTLEVDYVTTENATFDATPVVDEDDNTKVNIPLQDAVEGNWTIDLGAGFVTDLSQNANELEATEIEFVRGEDVEAAEPAELTVEAVEAANVVTLTFNGEVDGKTAIEEDNYNVEGATVKSAKLTSNTEAGAVVELTFEKGSIAANGTYQLVIDGVEAADGTLVDVEAIDLELTENIAPELESAVLVSGTQIELTFSEAMDAESISEVDFDVLLGGDEFEGTYTVAATNDKEFVITLDADNNAENGNQGLNTTQLAKTITLELTDDAVITDANGNALVVFENLTVAKDIK